VLFESALDGDYCFSVIYRVGCCTTWEVTIQPEENANWRLIESSVFKAAQNSRASRESGLVLGLLALGGSEH
jgi:hypothetical protein